jgi:pyruvate dehydrogenase E1 component alpha subunit
LAKEAVAWVKAGKGPVLLQLSTYRWPEHCGPNDDDHLGYRPEGELKAWQMRCPIKQIETKLQIGGQERLELQSQIQQEIDQAWNAALASSPPALKSKSRGVYAD